MAQLKQRIGGIAVAMLLASMVLWLIDEQQPAPIVEELKTGGLSVTVVEAIPANAQIKVNATGITMARWPAAITASVHGRVIEVANNTTPGNLVKKGEMLVSLQDTFYQAELGAALARASEAELNLAETLNRQHVARNSDNAKSAFGLLEPHVKAAKANREAAKTALASAEQQLADTQIKVPFDAVVIADLIHPGQWVNAGDELLHIAASDFLDIKVQLPDVSWQRLQAIQSISNDTTPKGITLKGITIVSPNGQQWSATIRYLSPVMDAITRQRSLMLQVANPFKPAIPLLADQHVTVVFEGEMQQFVVTAPASVLTEDGKVWSVVDKSLQLETIVLLDEQPESVSFRYQDKPEQKRLLVRFPLSSFLEGQSVGTISF